MRDRPNRMTRNPEKKIIEHSRLIGSDTRISTPTDGSTSVKDIVSLRGGVSVYGYMSYYTKGTPRVEATTEGVMTYSSPLV